MPSYLYPLHRVSTYETVEDLNPPPEDDDLDDSHHVSATSENEETVAGLHQTITGQSFPVDKRRSLGPFAGFEDYLRRHEQEGAPSVPLSVCFKNVTTYGRQEGAASVKTLKDAIVRTLTFQDIYEWTLKRLVSPERVENGRALIKDFTGVVRNGEMMLVLGNPGSGCSTFLRTIGNDHSPFLGVKGSIDYSGLSPDDVLRQCRGLVSYVPEDDVHLPTLTVRQTLEFALQTKTPKRALHKIPVFLEEFGRVFGMTHVMDTLVGNEFIRGVSGGERKRVSILESLASGSSVNTWDGSTRGLDASSAVDYIKSLRIMTDACQRATAVSLYQASDAIYNMVDKVMLIDEGRMIYQGPANKAESYFSELGYQRLPRQTMGDFLTCIPLGDPAVIREGCEYKIPRGAENLEQVFRSSHAFQDVQKDVAKYEEEGRAIFGASSATLVDPAELKRQVKGHKSRFVSSRTPYNTSFPRQVVLCTKREAWKLRGHMLPFFTRLVCNIAGAFLLGSMFYKMPVNTDGMYSRGGFSFYSAALVAWFQLAELEEAFMDRVVVGRQKRYAAVRPSAVVAGKAVLDFATIFTQSAAFSIVAYFLAGMEVAAGEFFAYLFTVFLCAMILAACYRTLGAGSPGLEVALRFCGVYILISVIFGGYLRSVERLVTDVPWVGWLAYTTPVLYCFEIIMAIEFHDRYFPCAPDSILPSGPGYDDPVFQSCAATNVEAGQTGVDGDEYLHSAFGFSYANVGRDFGILFLFLLGFWVINMLLVEKIDWVESGGGGLRYAKKHKSSKAPQGTDEEITVEGAATPVYEQVHLANREKGLVQSGSTFTWRDLHYTVKHKDGDKKLLDGVSGYCEPGKLTALVGASGAGKSTLMAVLTQQSNGTVAGDMKINDTPIDSSFGREIGYCQQENIHVGTSTVREAFEFSALLRQPAETSKANKLAYVDEVLDILGMGELQNVIIGTLSLEQKKRTTIGVELCAKPSFLLFLDEPTSGLDSQGAMSIVRLLRKLADCGQAIICTIHQASQEQFEKFDRVLALARGGKTYYFGDIGHNGRTVLEYFSRHGLSCDPDKNVADVLIEATAQHSQSAARDWCGIWDHSPEASATQRVINAASNETVSPASQEPQTTSKRHEFASSTTEQIKLLTKRTTIQYWRTPDYIYSRLYCSFFHSCLTGLAFLQLGNSLADMQYRIYAYFMVLMIVPEFVNACSMMFVQNRNIWLGRENPSRIYGWVAFTTAQIISEIPWALSGGVLYYVIFYFLIGFPLGVPAIYTFLMMMMFHLFSTSWGQWIAAMSADAVMAASIMPLFVIVCEFFNGVLQPRALMPSIWAYTIYYIGPFTYWISGIAATVLPGVLITCTESELTRFRAPEGPTCREYAGDWLDRANKGYLVNPDDISDCGYCRFSDGDEWLSTIELTKSKAWPYLGIFALFTCTNYLCVYLWVYVKSVRGWLPW